MMFLGYIFDVEGTLVDSVSYNLKSFQEALFNGSGIPSPSIHFSSTRGWMATRPCNSSYLSWKHLPGRRFWI
jgi:hypothetical protein